MKFKSLFFSLLALMSWVVQPLAADVSPEAAFTEQWNAFLDRAFVEKQRVNAKVVEARGLPREAANATLGFALGEQQDFALEIELKSAHLQLRRNQDELWIYAPRKKFGVIGHNDVPLYSQDPDYKMAVNLNSLFRVPMTLEQARTLPLLFEIRRVETVSSAVGGDSDKVPGNKQESDPTEVSIASSGQRYLLRPSELANKLLGQSNWSVEWHFADSGANKSELIWSSGEKQVKLDLGFEKDTRIGELLELGVSNPEQFTPVALHHLSQAYRVLSERLSGKRAKDRAPFWPEGVVRQHGKGKLTKIDGMMVLYLEGTPEEMGEQHGTLLKEYVADLYNRLLYGVGVGSSFIRGSWFFGDIEEAQARLLPHMNPDYLRELDALAEAAGLHRQQARLGNFFPELFHCSGFAVFDEATEDGMLYHGRILDYIRGMGLEESAMVIVVNPQRGNRWVNIGYAGFTGTVTAMNERGVAIGEMGGDGWGDWDGKPMAHLMREVMEKAYSVDEGVAIFRKSPRTCEYYYVISQANPNYAVGLVATPEKLETVLPGELHPLLQKPQKDTVMLSRGDRYECLTDRVREEYGKIDAEKAWWLMTRPVAMTSNIQSALFRPETLDFWVSNASADKVASDRKPVQFNLKELLEHFAEKPDAKANTSE